MECPVCGEDKARKLDAEFKTTDSYGKEIVMTDVETFQCLKCDVYFCSPEQGRVWVKKAI